MAMNAGDIIRDILRREGRTQNWLAQRMGVSRQSVNCFLRGRGDVRLSCFIYMLTILGYTFKVIKAGEDDE